MSQFACELITACKTCNAEEYPWECCYWDAKLGSRACSFRDKDRKLNCFTVRREELTRTIANLEAEAEDATSRLHFSNIAASLPRKYIPEVKLLSIDFKRGSEVIKKARYPIIAISLESLYRGRKETGRLHQARKVGLHKFCGYDGQILLTTDVNDDLCDFFLMKPDYFVRVVNELAPDYLTTFDSFTYFDMPAYVARHNINRTLKAIPYFRDCNARLVGLVLGSNSTQIRDHARTLTSLGMKLLAYPSYELRRGKMTRLLQFRIDIIRRIVKTQVLALSCSAWSGNRTILADYYSSYSWFPRSASEDSYLARGDKTLKRISKNCENVSKQEVLKDWEAAA